MSLDVSKNIVLETLYCSENQLTSLDMSKNIVLGTLYCRNNQLTTVALNALFVSLHNNEAYLKNIYIGNNEGTDLCDRTIAENKGWTIQN
jgi:Leucine-rich repeat (LRR) protein